MAAVLVAPHPEPRRPTLRLVVSTPGGRGASPMPRPVARRREDGAVYRRRRAVALAVVATSLLLGWVVVGALVGGGDDVAVFTGAALDAPVAPEATPDGAPTVARPDLYVVRPGDTVWSIAERLQPDGDVRALVDQLTERAGGSGLQAGQRIALDGLGL